MSMVERVHGGPQDAELAALGIERSSLVDFSVNTNPYGPTPTMLDAIRSARVDVYPDPTARAAREVLATSLDVAPDELALGNGAAELLWVLARVLLRPNSRALIIEPTFCELRAAAHAVGAQVSEWRASFAIDLEALPAADLIYLCTPNTPTGAYVPAVDVARWAATMPTTTVVLDQSFLSLSEHHADAAVSMPANVVRVRSLTKDHAIPGVRVGYLIASREIVARVEAARPAWMTSAMAQAAATASTREAAFVTETRARIIADRDELAASLVRLEMRPVPSSTCFFLVPVDDAGTLRHRLLVRHRVLVRDCASFGLPDHIRLAARPAADRARLIAALAEEHARC